ncbi:uncharacterized protein LOC127011566 [Drosophila biarmipes]|uniref:uncharacterized protein LOC127011566 n=1 Tax=Drosophila biarmipes TaxID=125945 RepID=UPI0021CD0F72|nr:uncharacterized protein LOC127011566 [Drosophila biarmipes]
MRPRDQRDVSIRLDGGGKQCVKDKRVKQGPWTLDPMWRVLACRVQKGNNGSQRPYINPQGAGSEISQSRAVIEISQSRAVIEKSQSSEEHPVEISQSRASSQSRARSRRKQRRGSLRGARSSRRDVRDWDY